MDKYNKIVKELYTCFKKNYVFIRVPKTASQSINNVLGTKWNHYSANFCKNELGDEVWNNAFTFGFVRNPWTRLKSWYSYHYNHHSLYSKYGLNGFNNWIKDGCPHHYNSSHQEIIFPDNPMLQKNWLCDESGEIIVNFVGKLENINADYNKIKKRLTFAKPKLPHKNKSGKKKFNLKYSEESIKIVNELFFDDFEEFNYNRRP